MDGKRLVSSETMSSSKKIILKSSDGESFEVDEAVALQSQTITHMIEDGLADDPILLSYVTSKILAKVIEYCEKHVEPANSEDRTSEDDLKAWDADFVKVDQATLFGLIQAANYLNNKSLLDLTCQTVADMVKGKTPEEIRKMAANYLNNDYLLDPLCQTVAYMVKGKTPEELLKTFNIKDDFEEEEVQQEKQWAFE